MARLAASEVWAAWRWGRADLRARGRSFLAAGVLFGLAGAVSAAFTSAAHRADTAFARFHDATAGADAAVFTDPAAQRSPRWAAALRRADVEAAVGYGTFPHRFLIDGRGTSDTGLVALAPVEPDGFTTTVEVPQLISGRRANPKRDDEVVVSTAAHRALDIAVGDVLVLETQTEAADDPDEFDGPTFRLTVVGIGRIPLELTTFAGTPIVFPSAGVLRQHDEIPMATTVLVRLDQDRAGLQTLRSALVAELGGDVEVTDLAETSARVVHGTTFERNGLMLVALGAAAVGLVTAAQALARSVDPGDGSVLVLQTIGLTRRARAMALAVPALVTATTSLVVMAVGSVAVSPLFPIGLSRQVDPSTGVFFDWPVLGAAAVALVVAVGAAAAAAAWSAAGRTQHRAASAQRKMRAFPTTRLPLVTDLGARLALESPGAGGRAPVRPVVLVTALGLVGVVATAVVVVGLDDALAEPARSGQHWEAMYFPEDPPTFEDELLARDDVLGVARAAYAEVEVTGSTFAVFAIEPLTGPRSLTVHSGRAPQAPDEIVLGVATARQLGAQPGDTVEVTADGDRTTLRVVGTGLALQTASSSYDEGSWVTPEAMERVGELSLFGEAAPAVLVHFDESVPWDEVARFPSPEQGLLPNQIEAEAQVVTNLRNVRPLPWLEGAFFGLLTVGSVAHLLWSTSRRRRNDLALLRALGFTRRQLLATLTCQGAVLGVLAVVLGVPLGLVVGGWVWGSMAHAVSLVDVGELPTSFLALVGPTTVLAAAGLASAVAQRMARRIPARAVDGEG